MMKQFIGIIVALVLGAALVVPAAAAPIGNPFYTGLKDPSELAALVEASLAKDASGRTKLSATKCVKPGDGSCATPMSYVEALKLKGKIVAVADLPKYLRGLKKQPPIRGAKYWFACLAPGSGNVIMRCHERPFSAGEQVWVDDMGNGFGEGCSNIMEGPAPVVENCAYIPFTVRSGITVARYAVTGPTSPEDPHRCFALKRAGEPDYEHGFKQECPDEHCDFSADVRVLEQYVPGTKVQYSASVATRVAGEYVIRVPKHLAEAGSKHVTLICIERTPIGQKWLAVPIAPPKDLAAENRVEYEAVYKQYQQNVVEYNAWARQWKADHSDAVGIWSADYRSYTARVYYDDADVPTNWSGRKARVFRWGEWARTQQK